jgi:hypothetical protein
LISSPEGACCEAVLISSGWEVTTVELLAHPVAAPDINNAVKTSERKRNFIESDLPDLKNRQTSFVPYNHF